MTKESNDVTNSEEKYVKVPSIPYYSCPTIKLDDVEKRRWRLIEESDLQKLNEKEW